MTVTMKTLYAGPDGNVAPGQTTDQFSPAQERKLIAGGFAAPVGGTAKRRKKAAAADSEPPEDETGDDEDGKADGEG